MNVILKKFQIGGVLQLSEQNCLHIFKLAYFNSTYHRKIFWSIEKGNYFVVCSTTPLLYSKLPTHIQNYLHILKVAYIDHTSLRSIDLLKFTSTYFVHL